MAASVSGLTGKMATGHGKEYKLLIKEMQDIEKKENKFLRYTVREADENKRSLRDKIPQKTYDALEKAFEKGFKLIFEKGGGVIESTGSLEKAREEGERLNESLERMIHPDTLKAVDKAAGSRVASSKFAGTADGTVLGVFGMGMPDIPIFLGLLLKSCYEIAAAYGFDYRDPRERKYTIAVMKTAFSREEDRVTASRECDDLAGIMERGEEFEREITDDDMKDIAEVLATEMLVAKFLQGFTFFGVVGGAFNYNMMSKISKAARLKYKKRFLYKHMLRLQNR